MNDVVEIFAPIMTKTSRGTVVKLWGNADGEVGALSFPEGIPEGGLVFSTTTLVETIYADVQPRSLSEYELAAWGVNDIPTDSRLLYYRGDSSNLVIGNRTRVNGVKVFEIRGVQTWTMHQEALLVPVQGINA
jgi:hypothetical protein